MNKQTIHSRYGQTVRRFFSCAVMSLLALPAAVVFFPSCASGGNTVPEQPPAPVQSGAETPGAFSEIWAYLMAGEEEFLDPSLPVSDIGYFGAGLSSEGQLTGVPDRRSLDGIYTGRVHLVVADSNSALLHFCLNPRYPVRNRLLEDIAEAAGEFDGVQIDFEAVRENDRENFFSFLGELKARIAPKPLSAALYARTRDIPDDPYEYARVEPHTDRILVMAYDEHWSGGAPGPVASMDWCARVAEYARQKIPAGKLVMGLPFYGRAWGEPDPSKAYRFSTLRTHMAEKGIDLAGTGTENGHPHFAYTENVTVQVYFDNAESVFRRAELYRTGGTDKIGFWRLGQEDPAIWEKLSLRGNTPASGPQQPEAD